MPRWLGFVWTSPNTLLGLVLGLLTFQVPRVDGGVLLFDRAPRGLTWLLPRLGRSAMTVDFDTTAYINDPLSYESRAPVAIRAQALFDSPLGKVQSIVQQRVSMYSGD